MRNVGGLAPNRGEHDIFLHLEMVNACYIELVLQIVIRFCFMHSAYIIATVSCETSAVLTRRRTCAKVSIDGEVAQGDNSGDVGGGELPSQSNLHNHVHQPVRVSRK